MRFKLFLDRIQEENRAYAGFGLVVGTRFIPLILGFPLSLLFPGVNSETGGLLIGLLMFIIYIAISIYLLIKTWKNKKSVVFWVYQLFFWVYEFMRSI